MTDLAFPDAEKDPIILSGQTLFDALQSLPDYLFDSEVVLD